jgi:hypothetical protein
LRRVPLLRFVPTKLASVMLELVAFTPLWFSPLWTVPERFVFGVIDVALAPAARSSAAASGRRKRGALMARVRLRLGAALGGNGRAYR